MQQNLFGIGEAEFLSVSEVVVVDGSQVVPELLLEVLEFDVHLLLMVL